MEDRTNLRKSVVLAVLAAALGVHAAPFAKWFDHRLADGAAVRIWGEGDEYAAHFETEDGRALVYNCEAGEYEYADQASDGSLVATGIALGDEAANKTRIDKLRRHLRDESEAFAERARSRLAEKAEATGLADRWRSLKENAAARREAAASGILRAPPSSKTIGRIVGVTVLVDFPLNDSNGVTTNTLSAVAHPDVTADDLRELVNGDSFTKYGNASSVRSYYHDATSGHMDYTNIVVGWVLAPKPRSHYEDNTIDSGTNGRELIGAILKEIPKLPNYDSEILPALQTATCNSDDEFLALNIYFAGAEGTRWSYGLWAHQWYLSYAQYKNLYITVDGKQRHFRQYQISPVTDSPAIHTFCHENGHMICDFPDLYAYSSGLGNGIGAWCLMCGRVSGGDVNPQNVSAYLRAAAGWVEPKPLPSTSSWVTVAADLQDVWKYPHPTDPKQYYLIENRQRKGRDGNLQSSGIVIYRCDESGDNMSGRRTSKSVFADYGYATNRLSYEVSIEQADGLYEIERDESAKIEIDGVKRWKADGDPDDTWRGDNGAELYANQFNALTIPCARWKDGTAAKINLSAFSANGDAMTFWSETESVSGGDEIDPASAIYVNGISTSAHSSYESSGEATYWRVTDGRIVLRGSGPYSITGTGTTPVRVAITDDAYKSCKVILKDLSVNSSDDAYGAFDCGSKAVEMSIVGTNRLVSAAYSEKKSYPALRVKSGAELTISGSDDATLICIGGKYAAGIGGGYSKGLLSTGDNDCGTIRILGGNVVANGGYNGAGIGGGNEGGGGRLDVRGSVVEANGGTGAAGVGGGYKGLGMHFFNYGGTVWAKGGAEDGTTPDIGRGKDKTGTVLKRFYASGGSTTLANGYVTGMMSPSNATQRVYRMVIGNLTPNARYEFSGFPSGYGQSRIVADGNGEAHLWLPNDTYTLTTTEGDGDIIDLTATIDGGKATAVASSDYGRWLRNYGLITSEIPTPSERDLFRRTTGADKFGTRKPYSIYEEYVAGTIPNQDDSLFRITAIDTTTGLPAAWTPDLGESRTYTIEAKENLDDETWGIPTESSRFFRVKVEMRETW